MFYLLIPILFCIGIYAFLQTKRFGKHPQGDRLNIIEQSPNYQKKKFQNSSPTPDFTNGATVFSVMRDFLLNKDKRSVPSSPIPTIKTNLKSISPNENCLVWFGHSSYFLQVDGKKFLIDPVLNGTASPIASTTRSFKGSDAFQVSDIPDIDYLIITHDHWDHLDYKTVKALLPRVNKVICPLGVGAHLEHWGFSKEIILEKNWHQSHTLESGFDIFYTPSRHFSGRGIRRQSSLWTSYVLKTPSFSLFLGGDSGYDSHFKEIGEQYGPFDLAILECGQYNKNWSHIHMMPEEVVLAAIDLKAEVLLPVHWAKFSLSMHAWDEPIKRVLAESKKFNMPIIHPMIGELSVLKELKTYSSWWETVE